MDNLTLIIPCLEEIEELQACLASVADRLPGQRVIVVHMGTWSDEAISGYGLDIQIIHARRRSASASRNLGASAATTPYIFFLDSDCVLQGSAADWQHHLSQVLAGQPHLVVLQRGETQREFAAVAPTRWNFARHCIEWNLVWSRELFFDLGALDEMCGTGNPTLAQGGEAFDICYRYFATPQRRTVYVPQLEVQHPRLGYEGLTPRKQFEDAYAYSFIAMRPLRRCPSLLALFWFARTLVGFGADLARGMRARSLARAALLLAARALACGDALTRSVARPRYGRIGGRS